MISMRSKAGWTIVAGLMVASLASARARDTEFPFLAPPGVAETAFPKPGRPVASIVSPIWHSEDERDAAAEVAQVVRLLDIKPGMTVADIGAGSGYYATRLSAILGPDGRVIAEDVMAGYLRLLEAKVRDLKLHNITISLGDPHDPRLPPHSIDLALMVHMYHEIGQPYGLLYNLASALKPGARVGIVDATRPTPQHGTPPGLLRCELAAAGYRELGFYPLKGSEAYLAVFEVPDASGLTPPDKIVPCKDTFDFKGPAKF